MSEDAEIYGTEVVEETLDKILAEIADLRLNERYDARILFAALLCEASYYACAVVRGGIWTKNHVEGALRGTIDATFDKIDDPNGRPPLVHYVDNSGQTIPPEQKPN